jgi:hypothetical protein
MEDGTVLTEEQWQALNAASQGEVEAADKPSIDEEPSKPPI